MFRVLMLSIVAVAMVVGCSSKKKTDDAAANAGAADTAIDQSAMSFDAAGSDSGKISGLATIFFDYDKAALTSEAKQTLSANAEWLKNNAKVNLQIEGHCDSRGTIEYNLALGERRAQSVKAYLVGLGVAANRLSVISYGEEKPLEQGETDSAMAKNRRANFVPLAQ